MTAAQRTSQKDAPRGTAAFGPNKYFLLIYSEALYGFYLEHPPFPYTFTEEFQH